MNVWLVAAGVLLVAALLPLGVAALSQDVMAAATALNLGGPVASLVLLLLAEGFHRQPFVDLALVLAVSSFVGSILLVRFLEWRV